MIVGVVVVNVIGNVLLVVLTYVGVLIVVVVVGNSGSGNNGVGVACGDNVVCDVW